MLGRGASKQISREQLATVGWGRFEDRWQLWRQVLAEAVECGANGIECHGGADEEFGQLDTVGPGFRTAFGVGVCGFGKVAGSEHSEAEQGAEEERDLHSLSILRPVRAGCHRGKT